MTSRFSLRIRIKLRDVASVCLMMQGNGIEFAERQVGVHGFMDMVFTVNIRQAEIVRCLFKNIKVYD